MTLNNAMMKRRIAPRALMGAATIAAAVFLLTISAKVAIPFYPVPLTMQTFVIVGLGLTLGSSRALAAVLLYLAAGLLGLPVFAGTPQQGTGLAYMLGPTGGYLLGYVLAVVLGGWLASQQWDRSAVHVMVAALLSGSVIYVPGLIWLGIVIGFDKPLLQLGLYPFIIGDIVKATLAAIVFPMAWKALESRAGC
ncbi:MAG: biotin transporter BioY [Mesorhizobium sp.]|nr:biotin transporter BioY [Mesorhizobium sp.]MBL8575596.1 biotin transporter BioY [Mesorhizobium sp.]